MKAPKRESADSFNAYWDKKDPKPSNVFEVDVMVNLAHLPLDGNKIVGRARRWLNLQYIGKHGSWEDPSRELEDSHFTLCRGQVFKLKVELQKNGTLKMLTNNEREDQ